MTKILILDEDDITPCYRNSGIIPIPRKISRRVSVPAFCTTENPLPIISQKLSCPAPKRNVKIKEAHEEEISDLSELINELIKESCAVPKCLIQPKSEAVIKAMRSRPNIMLAKIKTRELDVVKDMKRGTNDALEKSMRKKIELLENFEGKIHNLEQQIDFLSCKEIVVSKETQTDDVTNATLKQKMNEN